MAPKFWMAFSRFTITLRRDIATAPRPRLTDTIIGSISGVSPTATARAKKNASRQSCFVTPLMRNTSGTMTAISAIMSQVKCVTPRSKLVTTSERATRRATSPNVVRGPVASTTALAAPLSTLVPRKQRQRRSNGDAFGVASGRADFSTGMDSPVSAAWLTNRSFAERSRTSAGIMSPAASFTTSPRTTSRSGISRSSPSRTTVAVTRIIERSVSAAALACVSWMKRSSTPRKIITPMTVADRLSPERRETVASTTSSTTSGLRMARKRRHRQLSRTPLGSSFGPSAASRSRATPSVSPPGVAPTRVSISVASTAAHAASGAESACRADGGTTSPAGAPLRFAMYVATGAPGVCRRVATRQPGSLSDVGGHAAARAFGPGLRRPPD